MDAMPVYQSFNMVMTILSGLILLGEAESYSTGSLIGLSVAVVVIVAGILLLGVKKTTVSTTKKRKESQVKVDEAIEQTEADSGHLIRSDDKIDA